MPTSPLNGLCAHVSRWQHGRLMAPHCIPQPGIYTPFWCPRHSGKGVSCGVGMATSNAWETAEGASGDSPIPSTAGAEALGSTPLDSWGGGLDMVAVGAWWHLLSGAQQTWRSVIWLPSGASSSTNASTPPHFHPWPHPIHLILLFCCYPFLLPFQQLICKWKWPQMGKGDLARRSGKQMLNLMDQLSKKGELIQQWNCMTQKEEIIWFLKEKGESNLNLKASLPPHRAQQMLSPLVLPPLPAPMPSQLPLVSVPVPHSKKKDSKS